jgi:hypothetical protein
VLNVANHLFPKQVCTSLICKLFVIICISTTDLVPTSQKVRGARALSRMQISTMAVKNNLLVAGGFRGELVCKVQLARCTDLSVIACRLHHGSVF